MQCKRERSPSHTEHGHRPLKQPSRTGNDPHHKSLGLGLLPVIDDRFSQISTNLVKKHQTSEQETQSGCDCHVTGCNQSFARAAEYEEHYRSCHSFVCRYCHRFYATNHLLEIHLLETHDSLFSLMSQQRPMYQCLEPSCEERFLDSRTRDEHIVQCHGYPQHFKFDRRQHARQVDLTGGLEENRDVGVKGQNKNAEASQPNFRVPDLISFGIGRSELFREREANGQCRHAPVVTHTQDPMDAT